MGRHPLSSEEIALQRGRVVRAAEGLFAELGYQGVTLRAIAKALGQSHTAPYRYFDGKSEIFTAARLAAYARFAEAQEQACRESGDPVDCLARLGTAYVQFAIDAPDAYRLMFELKQPGAASSPELLAAESRAWSPLRDTVEAAVGAGRLRGDANVLAHLLWAGLHGIVSLHLAGKLSHGLGLDALHEPMKQLLFLGGLVTTSS